MSYNSEVENKAPTKEDLRASLQGRVRKHDHEESKDSVNRQSPEKKEKKKSKNLEFKVPHQFPTEPTFVSNNEAPLSPSDQEEHSGLGPERRLYHSKEDSKEEEKKFYGRNPLEEYQYKKQ